MNPRNTFVTVVEVKQAEKKTDAGIVLPTDTAHEYKVCEVVKVGPGAVTMKEEVSSTRDLEPGQTVLVKLAAKRQVGRDAYALAPLGVGFKDDAGRALVLVEESQIVGILAAAGAPAPLSLT